MITAAASPHASDFVEVAIAMGDDALILGHRLSEWSSRAPTLEEDIALSNLALDLLGQARALYTFAGETEGKGRGEDTFAYFRDASEFRNVLMVELPNGDFALTVLRQLFVAAFLEPFYQAMAKCAEPTLAAIAAKAAKEMAYHVRHTGAWVVRLGDGTDESRQRSLQALDQLWGYTGELFEMTSAEMRLANAGLLPDRAGVKPLWDTAIAQVLREATLPMPPARAMQTGGRAGRHTEHLDHLLAIMQVLPRRYPDARW